MKDLRPYSWQVIGVAWIVPMLNSLLCIALVADKPGVGKTITTLLVLSKYLDYSEGKLDTLMNWIGEIAGSTFGSPSTVSTFEPSSFVAAAGLACGRRKYADISLSYTFNSSLT